MWFTYSNEEKTHIIDMSRGKAIDEKGSSPNP